MKRKSSADAGMRTQVHNWMIKSTTESLSSLCLNKVQRGNVRSCHSSEKDFSLKQYYSWGSLTVKAPGLMSPRAEWMVTWPPAQAVFPLVQGFLPSLSTSVSQEEASFFLPYRTGDTKHKRRFCVFTCLYLNPSKCAVPRCMLVLTEQAFRYWTKNWGPENSLEFYTWSFPPSFYKISVASYKMHY